MKTIHNVMYWVGFGTVVMSIGVHGSAGWVMFAAGATLQFGSLFVRE